MTYSVVVERLPGRVRHITLGNISTFQPNFRKGLESTLPFLQAIRGLKGL